MRHERVAMGGPTIEQVRDAKAEILRLFRDHAAFAGAGIGECDGRLIVRVNWRSLPTGLKLPEKIGDVEVSHHEVGEIAPQGE